MLNEHLYDTLVSLGANKDQARKAADCNQCLMSIRESLSQLHLQAAAMNSEAIQLRKVVDHGFHTLNHRMETMESMLQQLLDRPS